MGAQTENQTVKERMTRRSEKTRKRIMAYSQRLFFERGFRKVTVEELCAGMGISKRTFYRYFPDRDGLVEAVTTDSMSGYMGPIIRNLTSDGPVDHILERHFDLLLNQVFPNVSTQMMADVQTLMPETWERIDQFRIGIAETITNLLHRGQTEGTVRKDTDPSSVGKFIQGTLTNLANPRFLMEQGLSIEQFVTTFQKLLLHGVLIHRDEE